MPKLPSHIAQQRGEADRIMRAQAIMAAQAVKVESAAKMMNITELQLWLKHRGIDVQRRQVIFYISRGVSIRGSKLPRVRMEARSSPTGYLVREEDAKAFLAAMAAMREASRPVGGAVTASEMLQRLVGERGGGGGGQQERRAMDGKPRGAKVGGTPCKQAVAC